MRIRILTILGFSITYLTSGGLTHYSQAAEIAPYVSETNPAGNIEVLVRYKHRKRTETLLVTTKAHVHPYLVPDERIIGCNDDEYAYDHDFYLSPDQRWLFVTRKLYHTVDVAYLYHRIGAGIFVRVRPLGMRFDEAAVRFFSRRLHLGLPPLEDGSRVTGFEAWTNSGRSLRFHFSAGRYSSKNHRAVTIQALYSLRTRRFSLVSETWHGAD